MDGYNWLVIPLVIGIVWIVSQTILFALKVVDVISWSWWWVMSPSLAILVCAAVLAVLWMVVASSITGPQG